MGTVVRFKRKGKLTNAGALEFILRRGAENGDGWVKVKGYDDLAGMLDWKPNSTYAAVQRWVKKQRAEIIVGADKSLQAIRAMPDHMSVLKRGKGTGVSKAMTPRTRKKKPAAATPIVNDKTTDKLVDNTTGKTVDGANSDTIDSVKNRPSKNKDLEVVTSPRGKAKTASIVPPVSIAPEHPHTAENSGAETPLGEAVSTPLSMTPAAPEPPKNRPPAPPPAPDPDPIKPAEQGAAADAAGRQSRKSIMSILSFRRAAAKEAVPEPASNVPAPAKEHRPAPQEDARTDPPVVRARVVPVSGYTIPRAWMLMMIAWGLYLTSISINIWNARSYGGDWLDMAIPVSLGILTEGVMFFTPSRLIVLPPIGKVLAILLLTITWTFALTNSLRMASLIGADQTMARADRETSGVRTASSALERARVERDHACRAGQSRSAACKASQADVAKLEKAETSATSRVASAAKPENRDFADLLSWVTRGAIQPGERDFSMWWLLLRTLIPQIGGLVLAIARRQ